MKVDQSKLRFAQCAYMNQCCEVMLLARGSKAMRFAHLMRQQGLCMPAHQVIDRLLCIVALLPSVVCRPAAG